MERIAYTCPGHSFFVSTALRDYDTLAGTFRGYETLAFSLDEDGRPGERLYEHHARSERQARRAHYVIAKRLSRLAGAEPPERHADA